MTAAPGSTLLAGEAPKHFTLQEALGSPDGVRIAGTMRLRQEALWGQFRPGFEEDDVLTGLRTTLLVEWRRGAWRIGGELYDSRSWNTDGTGPLTTGEVNTMEPVQAYVGWESRDAFGKGSVMSFQAGRYMLNLGSRRLVAADDYRNTTNGYTGLRADFSRPDRGSLTLYYVLPQERLPSDPQSLRDMDVRLDDESSAQKLWGVLGSRTGLPGGLTAELGYVGFDESDAPDRPSRDRLLNSFTGRLMRDPAPGKWDFEIEYIHQSGSNSTGLAAGAPRVDAAAHFVHVDAAYSFRGRWRTRLSVEYDLATGDGPEAGNSRFDTLFGMRRADLGPGGMYSALGRTNIETAGLRVEIAPSPRVDAFATYHALWAEDATDSFATTGIRDASGASGRFAGHQLDTRLRYWLIPQQLRAEFNGVWLVKGTLLRDAPNAPPWGNTSYLSVALTVNF